MSIIHVVDMNDLQKGVFSLCYCYAKFGMHFGMHILLGVVQQSPLEAVKPRVLLRATL